MISMPEGQIKKILRPKTTDELQLFTQASQKGSNWLPLLMSQTQ